MGHTLEEWRAKVADLLRDAAGVDLSASQIDEAGLAPAFKEHSRNSPRLIVSEVAGNGSAFYDLPAGWVPGLSYVDAVEYPARQVPPTCPLNSREWIVTRSTTDVDVEKIYLRYRTPAESEYVRFTYTGLWPLPTDDDADDDELNDAEFEGVAALAASYCCKHLSSQAARSRDGALPTDVVVGDERHAMLTAKAVELKQSYKDIALVSWGVA